MKEEKENHEANELERVELQKKCLKYFNLKLELNSEELIQLAKDKVKEVEYTPGGRKRGRREVRAAIMHFRKKN